MISGGGSDVVVHDRQGQRAIFRQAGKGCAMGGGNHHIYGQNGIQFGKNRAAEFNQRGGINGAVGRAFMVKACSLAFRHRPAVRPKQDNLGIGLSGVNNGYSTRQL